MPVGHGKVVVCGAAWSLLAPEQVVLLDLVPVVDSETECTRTIRSAAAACIDQCIAGNEFPSERASASSPDKYSRFISDSIRLLQLLLLTRLRWAELTHPQTA